MDQDAGVREGAGDARHLIDRDAFFHQRQQPVGGDFQAAGNGDAAAVGELQAEFGRERLLEADVAPPGNRQIAPLQFIGQRAQRLRRGRLVDKVETAVAGLVDDALDAVDQRAGVGRFEARDVVEADVAEAAFLPVAAMRHGELVPAPIAP
ncbi:hypothetical protein SDC9_148292 [bioreactor metagenome]|uniref:Uncharacterized protein n=1 Tax=bioreactor metagenome TaxID=1076179 RepID=A0A645EIX0_9ZZZZ